MSRPVFNLPISSLHDLFRRALSWFRSPTGLAWSAVVLVCVASRLATAISYIEDPDSLRFALSVADEYDVAALQPHFPGYPVFWIVAEGATLLTRGFSAGFSLVGGLATAGIVWSLLRMGGLSLRSQTGIAITGMIAFNPLIWLMGNRYMPDLLGTALVLACLAVLLHALRSPSGMGRTVREGRAAEVGVFAAGVLAGLRLSYLPLVILPVMGVLWLDRRRLRVLLAGVVGVGLWLVPMVADTGLATLYDVAWAQTTGHFTEFGGTVETEPNLARRLSRFVRSLWADGLGAWWPGRHPLTAAVGLSVLGMGSVGFRRLWRRGVFGRRRLLWIGACALCYALWVFFFQNVVHKSRHVLPLLPLLLVPLAVGGAVLWRRARWGRAAVGFAAATYGTVAVILAVQHRTPTAIAQVKTFVDAKSETGTVQVVSDPLVNDYLRVQEVEARYLSVEDSADVQRVQRPDSLEHKTLVVGTYASILDAAPPDTTHTFYHNPYVNRMWPEVSVYVYDQ